MAAIREVKRTLPASVVPAVIPLLLYFVILLLPVPVAVSRIFWFYSIPAFCIALLLFYLGFRLRGPYGGLAPAALTMLLLGLALSFLWHSGYSDDKIIGGLLPFRDAFDYYGGANRILAGNPIKAIDAGAAWRPLYPGFLAAILWITGQNLQWALALQVGLAGLCFVLAAQHVRERLGPGAAALFITLIFFYIQPLIGTAYTETLGLALGCLGFVFISSAAHTQSRGELIAGLVVLMLAVSERAGAFFIFPVLVVWAGWAFRGEARFSWRWAGIALLTLALTYVLVNTLYNRLMVEPGNLPFGNFAFTLYGQVTGGTGYHRAFEDLGVRNPAVILRAAERFFLAHPVGFVVGSAKAYRDFFSSSGIFSFGTAGAETPVWILGTLLLAFGVDRAARGFKASQYSLLLAGLIGIILSIPFLPIIDGGIRIYAATMPFLFALPALAVASLLGEAPSDTAAAAPARSAWLLAIALGTLMVVLPVFILALEPRSAVAESSCPDGQVGFGTVISPGAYLDLIPAGANSCGNLPAVCQTDFETYAKSNDPSDAEMYSDLISAVSGSPLRVFAANDLLAGKTHVFVGASQLFNGSNKAVMRGCAVETLVKGRPSIYAIRSVDDASRTPMP